MSGESRVSVQLEPRDLDAFGAFFRGGGAGDFRFEISAPPLLVLGAIAVAVASIMKYGALAILVGVLLGGSALVVFRWWATRKQHAHQRKQGTSYFTPCTITISDVGFQRDSEG